MRKILAFIIIILAVTAFFYSCKVVKHSDLQKKNLDDEVTFYFESESFDAGAYVEENWENRVVTEITEKARPLEGLLDELRNDFSSAAKSYGIKKEDTSPYSFAVKADAMITKIDTESAAGLLSIEIPDLTTEDFCRIQIGPVIKKSMIRDYLSFIRFGDFENQIEYANVSRELNFYIRDNILNVLNEDYIVGETVSFTGVFTYDKSGAVLITPIELNLLNGNKE